MPTDLRVGDVLADPHLSGRPGRVTEVTRTWYGASIRYEYDGQTCASAVFDHDVAAPPAVAPIRAGVEVER